MSQLDIVEKRIPQDGRAVMHLRGKDIDMRTIHPADPLRRKSGYPNSQDEMRRR